MSVSMASKVRRIARVLLRARARVRVRVRVGVRVRARVRVVRARLCEGVDDGHRLLPGHELLGGRLLLLVIDPLL